MERLIYCVEDDDDIREVLSCALLSFQFQVKTFTNAEDLFHEERLPDLILLDIMLPGMSGLGALSVIRAKPKWKAVPVILLTAKTTEMDRVMGLDQGADDYISKPFSILELRSRINAVLRRANVPSPDLLTHKDLKMDPQKHTVEARGKLVPLTLKEFDLLQLLLSHPSRVLSREELLKEVWGYDYEGESRTLDMHIKTLRKKIGDDAEAPKYIQTIRGVGYSLA